jgi:DHA2 family methylenomycin A resistance protein-like MFS transporter
LVAVCLGYFVVILDTTIVNVALPALRTDLGAGVRGLQWVVDGYLLMFAALLLSCGTLADLVGAKRVFQVGLALFVVSSIGCGLAANLAVLVLGRVVQGVGAALCVPASLALLRAAYPAASDRARAIGVWGGIAGFAAAAGPILGGVLVVAGTWRLVFFVNVPIGVMAMALAQRHVPAAAPRQRAFDLAAQATGVLALAALTFALIEGGDSGVSIRVAVAAAVFVAGLGVFLAIERGSAAPMLPLGMFRDATFSSGNAVGLLINLGFYGELFVINLYFQQVRHDSALSAGLALVPQMGVVAVASALSGRVTSRAGTPRPTMLIGLLVGAAGLLGLVVAGTHTTYALLVAPLVAAGFGMAYTMPAATTAVIESAPGERAGLASGAVNAARQVGSVIGVALLGALVGNGASDVAGIRLAMVIAAVAFLAGALLTAAWVRPERSAGRRRDVRVGVRDRGRRLRW